MKLVRPTTLTDGATAPRLVSSTLAEPSGSDPAAWSSGTTYALGAQVYLASTHRIYQSLQAGNLNKAPASQPEWWSEVSGTNKWAMFDNGVSSASTGTSPLTVVFEPGIVDALVLLGLVGNTAEITITDGSGGAEVYSRQLDLQVPVVNDWYSYYFEPFRQVPVFVMTDLPPYLNAYVTVTITGDTTVSCGMCIPGRTYTIGDTLLGVQSGIRDFSRKATDETTGAVTLEQRKFAKTLSARVKADTYLFNEVSEQLEQLRSTPAVWIADKTGALSPLTVFGFYKDFRLVVDYATFGVYSLEIEGMV
ncbi:MAG: hypothetical protein MUF16_01545 [Burkholderiaceae bacterium]|jgi:hypothetical protein|nr:hypothetical protein [Burkholderiaceae bacterium]